MKHQNKRQLGNIKLFLILFFIAFGLGLHPAKAIEYGMLGGKPANPDPKIENNESWFIYNLKAGEAKQDAITVMNLFDNPLDVMLYPADSTNSSNGGFALKQISEPKEEVGSWVKFYTTDPPQDFLAIFQNHSGNIIEFCKLSQDELQAEFGKNILTSDQFSQLSQWCQGTNLVEKKLNSKETTNIPFVISIPDSADVGEHTGGILIQKKLVDDQAGPSAGSTVKLTTRVGVRIYETVPGDIVRKLSLDNFKVIKNFSEFSFTDWFGEKKSREYLIQSNLSNSGNVSVEHENNVLIKNLIFSKDSQLVERKFQVLKKDKFIANMSWKKPLFGYYSFQSQIKYQGTDKEETLLSAPVKVWIIPWREATLSFILLAALVGIYFAWRYFYNKKYGGIGWVDGFVQKNDTVASLAKKYNIDWKVLVKTNKIKAPFLLEAGQIILLPDLVGESQPSVVAEIDTRDAQETPPVAIKKKRGRPAKVITQEKFFEPAVLVEEVKPQRSHVYLYKIIASIIGIVIFIALGLIIWKKTQTRGKLKADTSINTLVTEAPITENVPAKVEDKTAIVEPVAEKIDQATLKISVLNGGGAPGTAGKVKDFLLTKGYVLVEAKNAENKDNVSVMVYYKEDNLAAEAKWIAEILGSQKLKALVKKAETDEQKSADITVILGK